MTDTGSWDAFWAEVSGTPRTETIRGVTITVPTDLPLAAEKRIEELEDSERWEDTAELVALLFGVDALQTWADAGMGLLELQVVLAWGMAHARGLDVTFADVYKKITAADADSEAEGGEGKPAPPQGANRAARRAQSASTGGRSKRTSNGSTASARKTSRV